MNAATIRPIRRTAAVGLLAVSLAAAASAAPSPAEKNKKPDVPPARPTTTFSKKQQVPVPLEFKTRPKPSAEVLLDVPKRRRISYADWLKLFGDATDAESSSPLKLPPFDEAWGEVDESTGTLSGDVQTYKWAPGRQHSGISWTYRYNGKGVLDVDLAAELTGVWSHCEAWPGDQGGGGAFSRVTLELFAVDLDTGEEAVQVFYKDVAASISIFPLDAFDSGEPRIPIRLHPGHSYKFGVELVASSAAWADPSTMGEPADFGSGSAQGHATVLRLGLVPTHGPRVEVKILDTCPAAYDTYDLAEKLILAQSQKRYFPLVVRCSVLFAGQYSRESSSARIRLREGHGAILPGQPETLFKTTSDAWSYARTSEWEARIVPPPAAASGTTEHTWDFCVMLDMEATPKPSAYPLDHVMGPACRVLDRLTMKMPSKPQLVVKDTPLSYLADLARWFVLAPAEETLLFASSTGCKASQPMPVLWAAPPNVKFAPPALANWKWVKVDWSKIPENVTASWDKPVIALNLEALGSLYLPYDNPDKAKRLAGAARPAESTQKPAKPHGVKKVNGTRPGQPRKPREPAVGIQFKRLDYSYFLGDPESRKGFLAKLDQTTGDWIARMKLPAENGPDSVLIKTPNGEYVPLGELLRKSDEVELRGSLQALYKSLLAIQRNQLEMKHLQLYHEKTDIRITGHAEMSADFQANEEDKQEMNVFFDFVPHPAEDVHTLEPFIP